MRERVQGRGATERGAASDDDEDMIVAERVAGLQDELEELRIRKRERVKALREASP